MRILISISNLKMGGAQTLIARLAASFVQKHSVYIYNLSPLEADELLTAQLPSKVKNVSFPIWLEKNVYFNKFCHSRFKFFLKKLHFKFLIQFLKVDIVHSHLYHSDAFVTSVLADWLIPIVLTDHGDYRYIVEQGYAQIDNTKKIFNRANAVAYLSDNNLKSIIRYAGDSKTLFSKIYNGVPNIEYQKSLHAGREKLNIPANALVFGMVARGIPEKGWAEAVQAFSLTHSLVETSLHLILVGDSEYLVNLQNAIDKKLNSFIHFVGYSSKPKEWIECFNVGLLPTYFPGESLPNSIIEYLSLSKSVIATEVGGIPEMISYEDQLAGFLIKLNQNGRSDVSSIANAMLEYAKDPKLLEQHSYLAKLAFDKFRIKSCVESYESLFTHLLSAAS